MPSNKDSLSRHRRKIGARLKAGADEKSADLETKDFLTEIFEKIMAAVRGARLF